MIPAKAASKHRDGGRYKWLLQRLAVSFNMLIVNQYANINSPSTEPGYAEDFSLMDRHKYVD
jgi:hypothetical protein